MYKTFGNTHTKYRYMYILLIINLYYVVYNKIIIVHYRPIIYIV